MQNERLGFLSFFGLFRGGGLVLWGGDEDEKKSEKEE